MPRPKKTESTIAAVASTKRGDVKVTDQLSELLRALMTTLGTAYAEDATAAVTDPLEAAKAQVLTARRAAQEAAYEVRP